MFIRHLHHTCQSASKCSLSRCDLIVDAKDTCADAVAVREDRLERGPVGIICGYFGV